MADQLSLAATLAARLAPTAQQHSTTPNASGLSQRVQPNNILEGWDPLTPPRSIPGNPVWAPKLGPISPGVAQPLVNPVSEFFKRHPILQQEALATHALPAHVQALLAKPVSYFKENGSNGKTAEPALTHIAFVLDESTSMQDGKEATVEGFNAQVAVIRDGAKQAGATTFTDVRFSTQVRLRSVAGSLESLQPLTYANYNPEGWTALHDAIGATIAALLNTTGIDNPNTATLVTVFTDGDENQSKVYDGATLRALIERLEATGRWTFALVGPLQSVTGLAELLSVNRANIAGFNVADVGDKRKAFSKVASASAAYMGLRSMGTTQSNCLYNDTDLPG